MCERVVHSRFRFPPQFANAAEKAEWLEDHFQDFVEEARDALVSVGVLDESVAVYGGGDASYSLGTGSGGAKSASVERLLNRLLGCKVEMQERIFDFFEALLENEVAIMKKDGTHSEGIVTAKFEHIKIKGRGPLKLISGKGAGSDTLLYDFETDRGVAWAKACAHVEQALNESGLNEEGSAADEFTGFWRRAPATLLDLTLL